METVKSQIPRKLIAFCALLILFAIEFLFAIVLAYSVLQYLAAVMDLAQLTPDTLPTPAP